MVGSWVVGAVFNAFPTCAVSVYCCPCYLALFTCSWLRKRTHIVAPSISSRFFSLFLKPSTERNREWTDGVRSFVSPDRLALCFAPIAAWSYFSTAYIYPVSFFIADVASIGSRVVLVGYVEESLSYSTMLSTSSNRASNAFCVFAIICNFSVVAGSVVVLDLVFR